MNEPQVWAVIGVLSATLITFATALIGFLNSRVAGIQRELGTRFASLERQLDARFDVLDRDVQAIAGRVFGTDRD